MARGKRRAGRGEATAPVAPQNLGPARRASRASIRKRRRKQRRQRTSVLMVAGIALAVVAAVVFVGNAVTSKKPSGPKVRTQRTLLLEVTNANGAGRAAVLLAYDPVPARASVVLIPPHTLADVAGIGNVVLGNAVRLGGPTVAREAVSDLMGVLVDADWTVTSDAFAGLVNSVGGVVVDVDVDVIQAGPRNTTKILVRAGPGQRLDGATALAYATYVAKGQDEITSQARLQGVLEALLDALPDDRTELATKVTALGRGSALNGTKPLDLAEFLEGVRAAHAADRYEPSVLPVSVIDTGSGSPTFSIKVDEVGTLVKNQLADSIPPNRDVGDNRVLILNGVGTPGLGASVAQRLRSQFRVVGTRNKQPFGVKESVVVVFDSTDASLEKARRAAGLLRLPATAVRISTQTQSVADLIVVIGADYKP
jgi:LCP family protein required for cell wall assembly